MSIFNIKNFTNLTNMKILIIGCTSLTIEILKNFSMLGIGKNKGKITLCDDDIIKESNINNKNNFFFGEKNLGMKKIDVCKEKILKNNKDLNINLIYRKINEENDKFFSNEFWNEQNILILAVTNKNEKILKYLNKIILIHRKILFIANSKKTKGKILIFIPEKTSNLKEEISIKNKKNTNEKNKIPSNINQCIFWSLKKFKNIFSISPKNLNILLSSNKKNIHSIFNNFFPLKNQKTLKKIHLYKQLISLLNSQKFSDLVHFAIDEFQFFFEFSINDIQAKFPSDFLNKNGEKFWKGSKRQPNNLKFNFNDENHLNFIFSFVMILSKIVGINLNDDYENIKKNIKKIASEHILKIYDYTKNKEKTEEIINKEINVFLCDFNNLKFNKKFNEILFDFENDKNFHVDFIMNCANLRAENFKLEKIDFLQTKMKSGKIINTNYSVISILSGIITQNILTLSNFDNFDEIDEKLLKNCFFNVAVNIFLMVDVFKKKTNENIKISNEKIESWDVINVDKKNNVKEFVDFIKEKFNFDVKKIINVNNKVIDDFNEEILNDKIENLLKNDEIKNDDDDEEKKEENNHFYLEIYGTNENNEEIELPLIKYSI